MSAKNKLQNKRLRKAERWSGDGIWAGFERVPLSPFPRSAAVNVIANPKGRSTRTRRNRIKRALSFTISVPRVTPKDSAVAAAVELRDMPMHRLVRLLKKAARHASKCKHLIKKLDEGSRLHKTLESRQTHILGILRQALAEYQVRTT